MNLIEMIYGILGITPPASKKGGANSLRDPAETPKVVERPKPTEAPPTTASAESGSASK